VGLNARLAIIIRSHPPPTTSPMTVLISDLSDTDRCSKTAFLQIFFFVWCTLIAQIILTTRYEVDMRRSSFDSPLSSWGYRIYALTMKNVIITGVFVSITVTQLALGIHQVILTAKAPGTASIRVDLSPPTNDH